MHNNQNENCPPWYKDCLSLTTILATCFSAKEIKRLCRLTGWDEFQGETNPARLLEILHGACHG
ncbi:MAG: hypothetical protein SV487_13175 [Thermodesulfobacteriota bacterium]|nr:hypothetical protein [Thermodesulfobacteriota bacterium]